MAETWFFDTHGDGSIHLRSRTEAGPTVGDAFSTCAPGDSILNLSHDDLAKHRSGKITIEKGVATIVPET